MPHRPARFRDPLCAAAALTALACYMLACGPAWTPDGSQIAFPFFDPAAQARGIALHDLKSGKTERVWSESVGTPGQKDPKEADYVSLRWTADGKKLISVGPFEGGPDEGVRVTVWTLPFGTASVTHKIGGIDGGGSAFMPPAVAGDRWLFLGDKKGLKRVDLTNGQTAALDGTETYPIERDGMIYGVRETGPASENTLGKATELFRVNPETLTDELIAELPKDWGDPGFFLAVSAGGSRIALVTTKDKAPTVHVLEGGKKISGCSPPAGGGEIIVGALAWSADAKTLYAACSMPAPDAPGKAVPDKPQQLALLEMNPATGTCRVTPIIHVRRDGDETNNTVSAFQFQPALSPDGKTLAFSTACMASKILLNETDRGLYLVDLTNESRTVTKIPLPPAAAPEPGKPGSGK